MLEISTGKGEVVFTQQEKKATVQGWGQCIAGQSHEEVRGESHADSHSAVGTVWP